MSQAPAQRERRGLPIAAHLALLVLLAFGAAYVVNIAIVLALPPRPPDVMRSDELINIYADGYKLAVDEKRTPDIAAMRWRIQSERPRAERIFPGHMITRQLAERLKLPREQITVSADDAPRDHFVFRVRSAETRVEIQRIEQNANPRAMHPGHPIAPPPAPRRPVTIVWTETQTLAPEAAQVPTPPAPPATPAAPPPPASEAPAPPTPPEPPLFAPAPASVVLLSGFEIGARLPDGRWLVMTQGSNEEELGWIVRAAMIIGATLLALTALALFFARRLAKPIQNFATAVEAVGVNPGSAAVAEKGPRELRGAARAVNAMAARLRALVADRTQTLATVAHDMRTPLMRLRLAAENAPPEQRDKMAKEIAEVEALIASFIAFARDDPAQENRVRLDLNALLESLVDDQPPGRNVTLESQGRLVVTGQALGLKRLFTNLIDNAVKYGGAARITLRRDDDNAVIDIADDGPGIPADARESVFKPFVRLHGQSGGAGGAGLGLPAARSIARAHGGDVTIEGPEKGALVRTRLPL